MQNLNPQRVIETFRPIRMHRREFHLGTEDETSKKDAEYTGALYLPVSLINPAFVITPQLINSFSAVWRKKTCENEITN